MDPLALIYYAMICGALSYFAPNLRTPVARLSVGAAVGVVAASLLPMLHGLLGI